MTTSFLRVALAAGGLLLPATAVTDAGAQTADPPSSRRVRLGDTGLSLALPDGWGNSDRPPDHGETIGAFQSRDRTSSLFVSVARASAQADMPRIMEGVIANFETAFIVNRVGELKTGELAGSPAVFTTLEADLRSATGPARIAFRFYLAVLDPGGALYLVQASVQAPVKPEREREVMALIRSLVKGPPG